MSEVECALLPQGEVGKAVGDGGGGTSGWGSHSAVGWDAEEGIDSADEEIEEAGALYLLAFGGCVGETGA